MKRTSLAFKSGNFNLAASVDLPDETVAKKTPGVIFCHGFTGHRIETRRMYARLGGLLAARGIGCFRFDHRGCGESDGDFLDFTPHGLLEDLDFALEAFLKLPWLDPTRTAVVGYSLGGLSASYLLYGYHPFRTAVLVSPVARPDIIRERLAQYPAFAGYAERGWFDYGGFRVSPQYLDGIGPETHPLKWAQHFGGHILFIHGADDDIVKPEQTDLYIKARLNPGDEKFIVTGADHGFTTAANMDKVIERAANWIAKILLS